MVKENRDVSSQESVCPSLRGRGPGHPVCPLVPYATLWGGVLSCPESYVIREESSYLLTLLKESLKYQLLSVDFYERFLLMCHIL